MRRMKAGLGGIAVVLAVVTALTAGVGRAQAADPDKKKDEKKYQVTFNGAPWADVFKWLTNETGKEVLFSGGSPSGTFSFTGPAGKTYTLAEIIDLINAGLFSNSPTARYTIINGDHQFTVVPADQKIAPELVPHIDGVDELANRGDTEIVQMELPLTSLNAEDLSLRIGPIMGPFHDVWPCPAMRLHLMDTVRNLKRVVATLQADRGVGNQADRQLLARVQVHHGRRRRDVAADAPGEPQVVQQATIPERERDTRTEGRRRR